MSGRAKLYLALAIVGAAVPQVALGIFIGNGYDLGDLWDQVIGQPAAAAVLADVSISSLVFWFWLANEAPKVGVAKWGWFVVANLLVGLSFALPLFLYFRERRLSLAPPEPSAA